MLTCLHIKVLFRILVRFNAIPVLCSRYCFIELWTVSFIWVVLHHPIDVLLSISYCSHHIYICLLSLSYLNRRPIIIALIVSIYYCRWSHTQTIHILMVYKLNLIHKDYDLCNIVPVFVYFKLLLERLLYIRVSSKYYTNVNL